MERLTKPYQGPAHIPSKQEILPAVTIHKPDGSEKKLTEEQIEEFDMGFWVATHRWFGRELGC